MRVEAIVKEGGLFIPNPGIPLGRKKHVTLEISVVMPAQENDEFIQAAGILKAHPKDGVEYQQKLRSEWSNR